MQCLQPWNQVFVTTITRSLFHTKVYKYLGIESNAEIKDDFKYNNSEIKMIRCYQILQIIIAMI